MLVYWAAHVWSDAVDERIRFGQTSGLATCCSSSRVGNGRSSKPLPFSRRSCLRSLGPEFGPATPARGWHLQPPCCRSSRGGSPRVSTRSETDSQPRRSPPAKECSRCSCSPPSGSSSDSPPETTSTLDGRMGRRVGIAVASHSATVRPRFLGKGDAMTTTARRTDDDGNSVALVASTATARQSDFTVKTMWGLIPVRGRFDRFAQLVPEVGAERDDDRADDRRRQHRHRECEA